MLYLLTTVIQNFIFMKTRGFLITYLLLDYLRSKSPTEKPHLRLHHQQCGIGGAGLTNIPPRLQKQAHLHLHHTGSHSTAAASNLTHKNYSDKSDKTENQTFNCTNSNSGGRSSSPQRTASSASTSSPSLSPPNKVGIISGGENSSLDQSEFMSGRLNSSSAPMLTSSAVVTPAVQSLTTVINVGGPAVQSLPSVPLAGPPFGSVTGQSKYLLDDFDVVDDDDDISEHNSDHNQSCQSNVTFEAAIDNSNSGQQIRLMSGQSPVNKSLSALVESHIFGGNGGGGSGSGIGLLLNSHNVNNQNSVLNNLTMPLNERVTNSSNSVNHINTGLGVNGNVMNLNGGKLHNMNLTGTVAFVMVAFG